MELHQIPPFNFELRGHPLRDQMIERIRQTDGGFHRLEELERMSDYALLCAFEISLTMAGQRSADSRGKDMFDAGVEYGKSKVNRMNEGESVIPSSVESIKSQSKIWSNK